MLTERLLYCDLRMTN